MQSHSSMTIGWVLCKTKAILLRCRNADNVFRNRIEQKMQPTTTSSSSSSNISAPWTATVKDSRWNIIFPLFQCTATPTAAAIQRTWIHRWILCTRSDVLRHINICGAWFKRLIRCYMSSRVVLRMFQFFYCIPPPFTFFTLLPWLATVNQFSRMPRKSFGIQNELFFYSLGLYSFDHRATIFLFHSLYNSTFSLYCSWMAGVFLIIWLSGEQS